MPRYAKCSTDVNCPEETLKAIKTVENSKIFKYLLLFAS